MTSNLTQTSSFQSLDTSLRVLYWNAGGLNDVKFLQLKRNIYQNDVDIFFIVEAGVATEHPEYYQAPGYTIKILARSRQIASGILTGIKTNLTANFEVIHEMDATDKLEAVKVDAWKNRQHFSIINVYNPPSNIPNFDDIERNIQPNSILVGDFNSHSLRWGYPRTTPVGKRVEELIDDNQLDVLNTPPTFLSYGGHLSRPDLVITHPHISNKTTIQLLDDAGGCGHRALLVSTITYKQPFYNSKAPRWNFTKANWTQYRKLTDKISIPSAEFRSPEAAITAFNKNILQCALRAIPRGQIRNFKPFWNATLTKLKKKRDKCRRIAERTKATTDLISLRKQQARLHREIKSAKRSAFKNFISTLDFRKDGTKAHRFISRLNNDAAHRMQQPLLHGSRSTTDPKDISNVLCKHYTKISRLQGEKAVAKSLTKKPLTSCLDYKAHQLFDTVFTLPELQTALSQTKTKKAAGFDEVYPEFLTNLGENAQKVFLNIINLAWQTNVPQQWRKTEIVPVLKKGKPANAAESYRPISLTSACSKVAEKMVTNRLQQYIEDHRIIDEAQAGFREHRNTMDHVVNFSQHVKDGYHRKMSTLAVLVDFKVAYDTVWREMLIHKLAMYGVSGNMFRWIKSSLSQRQIRVRFSNSTSKFRIQKQELEKVALRFWERYKRVYKHQWSEYRQAPSRLKTQITPLVSYQNLLTKYNITPGAPAPLNTSRNFYHHLPPATLNLLSHNLPKDTTPEYELRQIALRTINEKYPEQEWLHIYTDGSSIPGTGETGAAYYCRLFQGHLAVGAPLSNYDGEVAAVLAAATELESILPPSKAVLLIDSQATIQNLTKNSKTDCQRTLACRGKLDSLIQSGWKLELQWIPSHVGITGNEAADRLAKLGTTLSQPASPATLRTAKAHINTAVSSWYKQQQLQQAAGKRWESLVTHGPIDHNLPRAVSVAAFRMRTGHDYLAAHLHRIHVLPSAECPLCGAARMDADHILVCQGLDHSQQGENRLFNEARLYWSARRQMAQQPRAGVG